MFRRALALVVVVGFLAPAAACARPTHVEPLPYVEVVTGGAAADAELPLIIALHGRGDTAEDFAPVFRDFPARARVAVLRPPRAWGGGQAWFLGARAHVENRPASRPSWWGSPIAWSPRQRRSARRARRAGGRSSWASLRAQC